MWKGYKTEIKPKPNDIPSDSTSIPNNQQMIIESNWCDYFTPHIMVYVSNFRLWNWNDTDCFPNFSALWTGILTFDVYTNDRHHGLGFLTVVSLPTELFVIFLHCDSVINHTTTHFITLRYWHVVSWCCPLHHCLLVKYFHLFIG